MLYGKKARILLAFRLRKPQSSSPIQIIKSEDIFITKESILWMFVPELEQTTALTKNVIEIIFMCKILPGLTEGLMS